MKARTLLGGLLALMAAAGQGATPAPPGRLADYLGYGFVGGLAAAESGDAVAWMQLQRGVRNIWVARAPDFVPRKLTNGTADDGQDLTALTWSGDGHVLVWERGEVEHNGWASGGPANPANATVAPAQEIWLSRDGATPAKVAEGEEPTLSATGRLAYVHDGQVWTADPAGAAKPARLFFDRGRDGSLAWSPDGTKLAFVSRRAGHSFVGIYAGADRPITWLAPTTAFDGDPAWSPDGRRIAFSRRLGTADILAGAIGAERPNPFSLWVASAEDGSATQAWQSPDTLNGSFPTVPDGINLHWAAGDRLTFRAELDGWAHLYALPVRGGTPTLLTPGDFMVEHVSLSPDRRTLLYSANAGGAPGDIDRRHVFRVAIDRPGPVALTPGSGLEWTPVPLAGGKLAFAAAAPAVPPHVVLADADGRTVRALDTDAARYGVSTVVPRPVTFTAADGLVVHGQLFVPKGGAAKKPALIFVHGGPPRQMLLGWSYMDYYTHAYAMNQYLASQGYVVLSVNYRLGIGYGRAFQHAAKSGASGNAEYQDVLAGAAYLKSLPEVDGSRLGIWGGSYGGLLTAQALARNSDIFKAGVDLHGVHDWTLMPGGGAPERYEQGDYAAIRKLAWESSPEAALATWRSPVLLIHGDDDRNVRFDQTTDLARRLAAQGTPYEEVILPDEIHGFLRYDSWLKADGAAIRFLDAHLKPKS